MLYNKRFLKKKAQAAKILIPIVKKLISPKSVLDVGCGCGAFLAQFNSNTKILGIEGPWFADIDSKEFLIPKEKIVFVDATKPLKLGHEFDLVVSLEVAEHIKARYADTFISNLTKYAPVVLFSAAIPGQAGPHHVNMQWPDYWVKKFRERGFVPCDVIRKQIWFDERIAHWYRQNVFLYIRKDKIKKYGLKPDPRVLSIVHPELYEAYVKLAESKLGKATLRNYIYSTFHKGEGHSSA